MLVEVATLYGSIAGTLFLWYSRNKKFVNKKTQEHGWRADPIGIFCLTNPEAELKLFPKSSTIFRQGYTVRYNKHKGDTAIAEYFKLNEPFQSDPLHYPSHYNGVETIEKAKDKVKNLINKGEGDTHRVAALLDSLEKFDDKNIKFYLRTNGYADVLKSNIFGFSNTPGGTFAINSLYSIGWPLRIVYGTAKLGGKGLLKIVDFLTPKV